MGTTRRLALISAIVALILSVFGSTAFAADFPGVTGTDGNVTPATGCISSDGDNGTAYDGTFTGVDASNGFVNVEFWIRGTNGQADSPEYDTVLSDGMFGNTYTALVAKTWTYPSSNCTAEQVTNLVNAHVAARQATPDVNNAGFVVWAEDPEMQALFPLVSGTTSVAPAVTDPDTTTLVDPASMDASVILASANNDAHNPYEQISEGDCQQLSQYDEVDTEVATSGSYQIVTYVDQQGMQRLTLLPHGRSATNGPLEGLFIGLDVNCSYADAIVWVNNVLQMNGLNTTALISWKDTDLFNKINRRNAYFGVGNGDSDRESCKVGLGREGLIQGLRKHDNRIVANQDIYVHVQAWKKGINLNGEQEAFVFVPAGQALVRLDDQVKGWFWIYDARYCSAGNLRSQMGASVQRRVNHDAATNGSVENWDDSSFVNLDGARMNNPFPSWFRVASN